MKTLKPVVLSITFFLMYLSPAYASDLLREKRMADEIVDTIVDGDAVFLNTYGHEFLSIYTEADEPKGAVIILHGRGFHPDWQDTINPLRVGLAESGWNTLSVQMPVLEKQAKYFDYVPIFPEALPRIDAAIKYVREQANNTVVLITHSCGAHMAMAWFEAQTKSKGSAKIDAYVGIGMGATDYKQPMVKPFPLDRLTVPVLDVYAENDYPAVLKMAPERLRMLEMAGNKKSKQMRVMDADHYYVDQGEALTEVVGQWLNSL